MSSVVDICAHNALPLSSLIHLLPPLLPPRLVFYTNSTIPGAILEGCFILVATHMKAMYERSTLGWSDPHKIGEMKHPDMRFLVLYAEEEEQGKGSGLGGLVGFTSFMVTEEGGEQVVYCYELHIVESWRNFGHGERLLRALEGFGRNVGVGKAMLTVFAENTEAIRFYRRIGYDIDAISPAERTLDSGEKKGPPFYIFSKLI